MYFCFMSFKQQSRTDNSPIYNDVTLHCKCCSPAFKTLWKWIHYMLTVLGTKKKKEKVKARILWWDVQSFTTNYKFLTTLVFFSMPGLKDGVMAGDVTVGLADPAQEKKHSLSSPWRRGKDSTWIWELSRRDSGGNTWKVKTLWLHFPTAK